MNSAQRRKKRRAEQSNMRYGCGYQGYEFGAGHYPDSLCIEGHLIDADSDGWDMSVVQIPCPKCNTEAHKRYMEEFHE